MCYLIDVWTDTTGSSVISAVCVSEVYISRDALVRSHDVKHEKWSVSRKRLNSLCRQTFQPFSFYCSKPRITTHVSPSSTSETVSANMLCAGVQALMRGIHYTDSIHIVGTYASTSCYQSSRPCNPFNPTISYLRVAGKCLGNSSF